MKNTGPFSFQKSKNHGARGPWLLGQALFLILCVVSISVGRCEDVNVLEPIARIHPPDKQAVLDFKGSASGVSVRLAEAGWVFHQVSDEGRGLIYQEGALDGESRDFVRLPRVGNLVATDDNRVRIQASIGFVTWEQAFESDLVAFGVRGNSLSVGGSYAYVSDGTALWLLETLLGAEIARIDPEDGITAADLSSDLARAYTLGGKGISIWDVESGTREKLISIDRAVGGFLRVLPDEERALLTTDSGRSIELWNLVSEEVEVVVRAESELVSLDVLSDVSLFSVGRRDGSVTTHRTMDGVAVHSVSIDDDGIQRVALGPRLEDQTSVLWVLTERGAIHRFDQRDGQLLAVIDGTQVPYWPTMVELNEVGSRALVRDGFGGEQFVYDLATGGQYSIGEGTPRALTGDLFEVRTESEMAIWTMRNFPPERLWRRELSEDVTTRLVDGRIEIESEVNGVGETTVIDPESGQTLEVVTEHRRPELGDNIVSFPTRTSWVVRTKTVREFTSKRGNHGFIAVDLVDSESGELVRRLDGNFRFKDYLFHDGFTGETTFVRPSVRTAVSPNARLVAVGVGSETRVWDVLSGRLLHTVIERTGRVQRLVFGEASQNLGIRYSPKQGGFHKYMVWRLDYRGFRKVLDEIVRGASDIRLLADQIEIDGGDVKFDADDRVRVFNAVSGRLIETRPYFGISRAVSISGNEPERFSLRTIQEIESSDLLTRRYALDIRPLRGFGRWTKTVLDSLEIDFPFYESGGESVRAREADPDAFWLEDRGVYVFGLHDRVIVVDDTTHEITLDLAIDTSELPMSGNHAGYRTQANRFSADGQRLLLRLTGSEFVGGEDPFVTTDQFVLVVDVATGQSVTVDIPLADRRSSRVDSFIDDQLTVALVPRETQGFDLYDLSTGSVVGTLPTGEVLLTGSGNRFFVPSEITQPGFSGDASRVATVDVDGIAFWEVPNALNGR